MPSRTEIAKAALIFGGGLFAMGFALAIPRELWLKPRLGELGAVMVELPVILCLSWVLARLLMRGPRQAWCMRHRLVMGAGALACLLTAEAVLSIFVLGQTWSAAFSSFTSPKGLAGIAAQALACSFPFLQQRMIQS